MTATTLRTVKTATLNDWGAICWANGEFHEAVHRPNLEIFDRVGGGDSFASGLIYGLIETGDASMAVQYGAARGREFNIANRDVTWRFRTKSDGYLKVVLRDLFNQVSGSVLKPYILSVQKDVPEYQLVVYPQSIPIDKNKRNIDLMGLHLRKGGCLYLVFSIIFSV